MLKEKMAENEENLKRWTHAWKELLLSARLQMEQDFRAKRKKRAVLWERVYQKMKKIDPSFPFSRDDVTRKFLNFMVTYKRIKKRNRTSGEAATTWEYFETLDEVYGSRADISVNESNLDSSIGSLIETLNGGNECGREAIVDCEETVSPVPRKRAKGDILEFLKQSEETDKAMLEEILKCERETVDIEKQKLEEMKKLREALLSINK